MSVAHIAVGSNLGDRAANLLRVRRSIDALRDTRVAASSGVYETEPVGPVEQGPFYNAVLAVETECQPLDLLDELLAIESAMGRRRREPWGPRVIDLDLLQYDGRVMSGDRLTLPHPRMHERSFVLRPLCDVAPDLVHPTLGRPARELLAACDPGGVRPVAVDGW